MPDLLGTYRPVIGLGMLAVVLGTIALILFFMPVLGVPISSLGLLCGLVGFLCALFVPGEGLRWSVAGVAMSSLALLVNVAMTYAPAGYLPTPNPPPPWQPVPDRPYVPPPAGQLRLPASLRRQHAALPMSHTGLARTSENHLLPVEARMDERDHRQLASPGLGGANHLEYPPTRA
jgi:hypothetical protein